MRILVCIKAVPDSLDVSFDTESGRLLREKTSLIMNSFDQYALEAAVRWKETSPDTVISVLSMGASGTESILQDALAIGADEAFLMSDTLFAGADAPATAKILSKGISLLEKRQNKKFDMIFTGMKSTDGGTHYITPALACLLGRPFITRVITCICSKGENDRFIAFREWESGTQQIAAPFPCVAGFTKAAYPARYPKAAAIIAATQTKIPHLTAADLGINETEIPEMTGSCVKSVRYRPLKKKSHIIREKDPGKAAARLAMLMKRSHLI